MAEQEILDMAQQIDRDIKRYEEYVDKNNQVRDRIVNKLSEAVDKLSLNPDLDKPTITEAKMGVVNSLLKALSDTESSKSGSIKLKQRSSADQEAEDSLKMISRTVAEYAKNIDSAISGLRDTAVKGGNAEARLDQAVTEAGIEINDEELMMTGTSAKDIMRDDTDDKEEDD